MSLWKQTCTEGGWHEGTREKASGRACWSCRRPDLPSASRTVRRTFVLFQTPGLWSFVRAAPGDCYWEAADVSASSGGVVCCSHSAVPSACSEAPWLGARTLGLQCALLSSPSSLWCPLVPSNVLLSEVYFDINIANPVYLHSIFVECVFPSFLLKWVFYWQHSVFVLVGFIWTIMQLVIHLDMFAILFFVSWWFSVFIPQFPISCL